MGMTDEERASYMKAYYIAHRDIILARSRAWWAKNKDRANANKRMKYRRKVLGRSCGNGLS